MSRDDVVLQRPEDLLFLVPVFHTPNACSGAATAYLLRRIAYRAGAYAPGIQEHIFHELNTSREGGTIEQRAALVRLARVQSLHELGYRLQCRRVAMPTPALLEWVRSRPRLSRRDAADELHQAPPRARRGGQGCPPDDTVGHAVGVTIDRLEPERATRTS